MFHDLSSSIRKNKKKPPENPDYAAMIQERIPVWDSIWSNTDPGDEKFTREMLTGLFRTLGIKKKDMPEILWVPSPNAYLRELKKGEQILFICSGVNDCCWLEDYFYLDDLGFEIFESDRQRIEAALWAKITRNISFMPGAETRVFLIDRPEEIHFEASTNERGMRRVVFHNETGPAIRWRDGQCSWQYQGIIVPEKAIMEPGGITAKEVLAEPNAEIRRIMLIRMGLDKFVKDAGGKVLDTKIQPIPVATWKRMKLKPRAEPVLNELLHLQIGNGFEHRVIRVVDPSTLREYILGVPTTVNTVDEALGWTFEMSAVEYGRMVAEN